MEIAVIGRDGQVYPTTPYGAEERRLDRGTAVGGCGGAMALDHDLVHPVAERYRLTVHYVAADGSSGSVSGEAAVDWIIRTPAAPPGVIINEFSTHGANGAFEQYVELKNVTSRPVMMTGWYINLSDNRGRICRLHFSAFRDAGRGLSSAAGKCLQQRPSRP
jgi:hypothetical protein